MNKISNRQSLLPIYFLHKIISQIIVVRGQIHQLHSTIRQIDSVICATRLLNFRNQRITSCFFLHMQLVLQALVLCLSVGQQQRGTGLLFKFHIYLILTYHHNLTYLGLPVCQPLATLLYLSLFVNLMNNRLQI